MDAEVTQLPFCLRRTAFHVGESCWSGQGKEGKRNLILENNFCSFAEHKLLLSHCKASAPWYHKGWSSTMISGTHSEMCISFPTVTLSQLHTCRWPNPTNISPGLAREKSRKWKRTFMVGKRQALTPQMFPHLIEEAWEDKWWHTVCYCALFKRRIVGAGLICPCRKGGRGEALLDWHYSLICIWRQTARLLCPTRTTLTLHFCLQLARFPSLESKPSMRSPRTPVKTMFIPCFKPAAMSVAQNA